MSDSKVTEWNPETEPFLLGEFEVDAATHCITREGVSTKLEPRAMALLIYLVHRPGSVVSREELEQEIWRGMVVGYDALNNTIAKLRKAFSDDPKNPRVIRTVPKAGYQLIAEVGVSPDSAVVQIPLPEVTSNPSLQRKLTAMLYADVVDYSRLTGLDEEGTHHTLRKCLDLMTELIERFHGSVVHFAGDAILAEFDTASNALSCAATMQQQLAAENEGIPDNRRMQFRIGVNLGEVIVDRGDIYGDGVNVAARLEALAEPGGICLSGSVFDAISHKLPLDYSFLGERHVKNIAKPVRAYQARLKPGMALPQPEVRASGATGRQPGKSSVIGALSIVLVVVVVIVVWMRPWQQTEVAVSNIVTENTVTPGKPSIAVLPFKNISDDPAQGFFADGMTDDLITDLSGVSGLAVVSRHAVFAYRNKQVQLDQMARELGVKFVLEGSVRRHEEGIRINATLVDVSSSTGIWSERYEGEVSDLFDLQNRVIGSIVNALEIELTDSEKALLARNPTDNLEAYDYFQRAERRRLVEHRDPDGSDDNYADAIELYKKAIDLDPGFAQAYAGLAIVSFEVWLGDGTHIMPVAVARKVAYDSASKVRELDPENPAAYSVLALLQATDRQYDLALGSARTAIELDPKNAATHAVLAQVLAWSGQHQKALAAIDKSFELNPEPPGENHGIRGQMLFFNNNLADAVSAYDKAHKDHLRFRHELVMVYAELGQLDDATSVFSSIQKRMPFINLGYYRTRYAHYKRPEDLDRMINALRKAGVPENAYGYTENADYRLDSAALETLVTGQTWRGRDEQGMSFVQQIADDGRVAFSNEYTMMTGTTRINGNSFCVQFSSSTQGREDCGYIYRNPEGSPDEQNEYVRLSLGSVYYFTVR